ncbi:MULTISPECIES: SET domain-containing protein-lysine N-methyltransferase [unclassified Mesorhizobium]|uniref:SET domain-containing protein-lysine N-methyltransferase n=2 Tax=Mesorhizobium TaxID=68287 RepID=UPI0019CF4CF9|nr:MULTISPECIES: SET domain-containing protein-lysine N-methyltransferase [unclassified Mesorhizobium]
MAVGVRMRAKSTLRHSHQVEMRWAKGKGRGVYAREEIKKGSVIEVVPVIIIPVAEVHAWNSNFGLFDYVFNWEDGIMAIALGYGSLYNHSFLPNAKFSIGTELTITFSAIRRICAGAEITINYNGPPRSRAAMDFTVLE